MDIEIKGHTFDVTLKCVVCGFDLNGRNDASKLVCSGWSDLPRDVPVLGTAPVLRHDFVAQSHTTQTVECSRCHVIFSKMAADERGHLEECRGSILASVKAEKKPAGDTGRHVDDHPGFKCHYHYLPVPPTWSRHEPKPVDPDSLIYNPVTREFE